MDEVYEATKRATVCRTSLVCFDVFVVTILQTCNGQVLSLGPDRFPDPFPKKDNTWFAGVAGDLGISQPCQG